MGTNGQNGQNETEAPTIIRRSDMGLAISGTRITLYAIMDYLYDDWPHDEILKWLPLTQAQLQAAIDYIAAHREEVEAEYEEVVRQAEERRDYWEERLREHLANRPPEPPSAEKAAFYKKLAEHRGQLLRDQMREREREDDRRAAEKRAAARRARASRE